ncbi:hypothetical protein BH09MYX1_BH09MYX1_27580 [soil metagenome]
MAWLSQALAVAIGVAAILSASRARAERSMEPVRLAYVGAANCPTEEEFKQRVSALTPKASFEDVGEGSAASLRIELRQVDAKFVGRLVYSPSASSEAAERSVSSRACEDVFHALALVAALAIDSKGESVGVPARKPTDPAAPIPIPPPPSAARAPIPPIPIPPPSPARWQSDLGVSATLATAQTPSALLGVRVGFDHQRLVPGILRPHFGVAVDVATSSLTEDAAIEGRFHVLAMSLRTCPLSIHPGTQLVELGACLAARVGAVFANGQGLQHPESKVVFWGEGVLAGRVRAGARWFFAELSLGLSVHPTRPTYYRETPFRSVYEAPWLGFDAAFGVGVHFP